MTENEFYIELTENAHYFYNTGNEDLQIKIYKSIEYYRKKYSKLKKTLGTELAMRIILKFVDETIEDYFKHPNNTELKKKIACKKGCSFCCNINVHVSKPEARVIASAIEKRKLNIDINKLKRQASVDDWFSQPKDDWACSLLNPDGSCSVYNQRPLACRKYFSIEKPELCNPRNEENNMIKRWNCMDAELVTSAILNEEKTGSLPEMLLQELNRK